MEAADAVSAYKAANGSAHMRAENLVFLRKFLHI
jgi:hypothetical protein